VAVTIYSVLGLLFHTNEEVRIERMKFGISAFAWTASFSDHHLEILPRVREYGYACLELPMFLPADLQVKKLRRAFESNDLTCTICAILPAGVNPISPDADIRRRSVSHLKDCVAAAAELGAPLLGGPLLVPIGYFTGHRPTEDDWKWAVEALQDLTPLLSEYQIDLSIEPVNRSETFFVRTAADALRLCDAVDHPNVGVTIDTFHANIEEKSITTALELLGSRLKHIHLSENDRGTLGSGHIDFKAVVQSLERVNFDGFIVVEGFGYSMDEPDAPGFLWADRNVSPEDLAKSSAAHLKRLEIF
jgi:D-psicose/D-tagatose/L-ribulose 3-epimerase